MRLRIDIHVEFTDRRMEMLEKLMPFIAEVKLNDLTHYPGVWVRKGDLIHSILLEDIHTHDKTLVPLFDIKDIIIH